MPPFLLILHWKVWWNARLSQWKTRPFAEHLICVSSCFWRLGSVGVKMAPHVGTFSLEKHCCSQCSIDAKMFSWMDTMLCAADTGWHFLMRRHVAFRRSLWFGNRDLFWVLPIWNQALIGQFEINFFDVSDFLSSCAIFSAFHPQKASQSCAVCFKQTHWIAKCWVLSSTGFFSICLSKAQKHRIR